MLTIRSAFTIILLTTSTCSSIICGVACDFIHTGEPGECMGPGGLFGACSTTSCLPGLLCWGTSEGSICLEHTAVADVDTETCGLGMSVFGIKCDQELCMPPCASDEHCLGEAVCSVDEGFCVHPYK